MAKNNTEGFSKELLDQLLAGRDPKTALDSGGLIGDLRYSDPGPGASHRSADQVDRLIHSLGRSEIQGLRPTLPRVSHPGLSTPAHLVHGGHRSLCRHVIVHTGGRVTERLLSQVSGAIPRDLKQNLKLGEVLQFTPDEVTLIAGNMRQYMSLLNERIGSVLP